MYQSGLKINDLINSCLPQGFFVTMLAVQFILKNSFCRRENEVTLFSSAGLTNKLQKA